MSLFSIDRRQTGILADRYLDVLLGDFGALLLTLLQAPLIGALVAGVWSNRGAETLTLYFVLCLSSFFLGAVNSSREIVRERALFLRERMFNLSIGSYLASKYRVQAILMVAQSVLLVASVRAFVPLSVNVLVVGAFCALTSFAGTAVGLLISAWVRTSDKAVAAVPLVVIPQILFSDFVIGKAQLRNWTQWAEPVMPVRWTYDALESLSSASIDWMRVAAAPLVIAVMVAVCFLLARISLALAEE